MTGNTPTKAYAVSLASYPYDDDYAFVFLANTAGEAKQRLCAETGCDFTDVRARRSPQHDGMTCAEEHDLNWERAEDGR